MKHHNPSNGKTHASTWYIHCLFILRHPRFQNNNIDIDDNLTSVIAPKLLDAMPDDVLEKMHSIPNSSGVHLFTLLAHMGDEMAVAAKHISHAKQT